MASTNKTTHLRLNQWVGSDPVLRTDFNLDNAKLDAAVTARALEKMEGDTLSASAGSITVDLADYDLTRYGELQLYLYPVTSGSAVTSLRLNGETAVDLASMAADGSRGLIVHLCFLPGGVGGWWFAPGMTGTSSGGFRVPGVTAENLTQLNVQCGGTATYQRNTSYSLYGVKK